MMKLDKEVVVAIASLLDEVETATIRLEGLLLQWKGASLGIGKGPTGDEIMKQHEELGAMRTAIARLRDVVIGPTSGVQ